MAHPLLDVRGLAKRFGGVQALVEISVTVNPHEIVGLIGPNGAGKTTLFNCITGVLRPDEGQILFGQDGQESLTGLPPHEIVECGIARTFQNIRLFANMTVLDHALVGMHLRTRSSLLDAIAHRHRARREERWARDRAVGLLEMMGLSALADERASSLPFGLQRRLEIARALAAEPELLLLDEPAAGLNPTEKLALLGLLERLRSQGLAMLLIDHDMRFVMPVSNRVVVLDHGQKIAEGLPAEIQNNPTVIEAYLGKGATSG